MCKKILSIKDHCACMAYVIWEVAYYTDDPWEWCHIGEWLDIASGIEKVILDTEKYKCNLYCSSAYEYDIAKDELLTKIVTQITIFNYVWGALESLIDFINPKEAPKNPGKINAICYFLKENSTSEITIPKYNDALADLLISVKKITHYAHLEERFKLKPFYNLNGVGLQVVYKLRNSFAHGSLRFSEPEDWNLSKPIDDEIVNLATRITLLSIQMILLGYFDDSIEIKPWNSNVAEEINLRNYLQFLHPEIEPNPDNQRSLFEKW